ncbi:MAG: hypothetical protein WCF30_11085 [Terracidiphilus sp.]
MMTPPPVSGMPYPNGAGSDERSNYLAANLTFSPSYIDNVLPGASSTPVSDVTYSILPSVLFDYSAPRQKAQFSYSPNFAFYEPTTALDTVDHNASAAFQYRFSPKVAVSVQDNFTRTSNVYDSTYLFSSPISGSTLTPTPTAIAPFAEQMINNLNGVLSYQFGLNAMIGGGGSYNTFDLPDPAEAQGLFNSHEASGFVFYNRRLSRAQYFGVQYEYTHILAYPLTGTSDTQLHSLLPFYTFYFNRAFSFSISPGIQHVEESEVGLPESNSWSPSGTASVGWQGGRGSVAGSFTRTVTAGGGLLGAFNSNNVSASAGWKLANTWSAALSFGYSSISSATPAAISSFQNGNILTAGGSLQHSIGEHFNANFQYQHLRESYNGISSISADPDSNREAFTISYQFRKPLGR